MRLHFFADGIESLVAANNLSKFSLVLSLPEIGGYTKRKLSVIFFETEEKPFFEPQTSDPVIFP